MNKQKKIISFNKLLSDSNQNLYKTQDIPCYYDKQPWLYNDEYEFYDSHGYDDGLGLHCVFNKIFI
ncbi:hypothetical protein A3K72_03700 [Candidatus Woesearchaeota archaeon RBG_13_36_6]|nr:MAG: hypothetical protein A3K72_03700 [Candidatus Woesearchaeota archaeon RBG_13_36_6]